MEAEKKLQVNTGKHSDVWAIHRLLGESGLRDAVDSVEMTVEGNLLVTVKGQNAKQAVRVLEAYAGKWNSPHAK